MRHDGVKHECATSFTVRRIHVFRQQMHPADPTKSLFSST
jgi:hypothetical protein